MANKWLNDTLEKIGETVKSSTQDVVKEMSGNDGSGKQSPEDRAMQAIERGQSGAGNFTKLDPSRLKKLENGYRSQDNLTLNQERRELQTLKQHYFSRFKQEEKRAIMQLRQKEMLRKQREEEEKERKKRAAAAQKTQTVALPTGKVRRSIFSFKRRKQASQIETKAASGKQ